MTGHGSFWLLCWENTFTVDLQFMIVKLQLDDLRFMFFFSRLGTNYLNFYVSFSLSDILDLPLAFPLSLSLNIVSVFYFL